MADKAFSPHPPFCAQCLMRRWRVLSCLQTTSHISTSYLSSHIHQHPLLLISSLIIT
ncbi:hypothetical protein ECDEC13E_3104 [Escherichia coli DEC13E]|nr:hypothetical protein ECDEC13E_3104 [Escherichia coli DEC13E]EIQ57328.1 hypothetical protein SD22575_3659 [Shigella dysenteriae 225-75]